MDVLGHALVPCGDDPTIFKDDNGTAYLCANCHGPYCGVLNPDLISFAVEPSLLSPALPLWFEAPWIEKIDGVYYLSYMGQASNASYSHYGNDILYGSSTEGELVRLFGFCRCTRSTLLSWGQSDCLCVPHSLLLLRHLRSPNWS